MSSVRALANILCISCNDITLHNAGVCIGCSTRSTSSGNPPIPRPERPYGYNAMRGEQYNAGLQAQGDARRRARAARHQVMRGAAKL